MPERGRVRGPVKARGRWVEATGGTGAKPQNRDSDTS